MSQGIISQGSESTSFRQRRTLAWGEHRRESNAFIQKV